MRKYEVAVVLHPDLEIDLEAPKSRVEELFSNIGAEIKKRDEWGKRKLAYPIAGQSFGVYIFYVIEAEGERITELEQSLQLNEEVMRHLIVAHEEGEEPESESDGGDTKTEDDTAKAKTETTEES